MNHVRAIVVAVGFIKYLPIGIIGYALERLKISYTRGGAGREHSISCRL